MDLNLKGQRILVVGASEGIGHATAATLAAEGAAVTLVARHAGKLEAAAQRIRAVGAASVDVLTADVTQPQDVLALEAAWRERGHALDALVVATGGSHRARFDALSDADWQANYDYNVLGSVRLVRAFLPHLRQAAAPSVLLFGGAAAKMPYPNQVVSNVHKAGLLALTKTLAAELAPERIRVNAICPGRTLTKLWTDRARAIAEQEGVSEQAVIERFAEEILVGRFAQPQEIADVAAFVLSPRASYIVGQSINVDGGIARGLL